MVAAWSLRAALVFILVAIPFILHAQPVIAPCFAHNIGDTTDCDVCGYTTWFDAIAQCNVRPQFTCEGHDPAVDCPAGFHQQSTAWGSAYPHCDKIPGNINCVGTNCNNDFDDFGVSCVRDGVVDCGTAPDQAGVCSKWVQASHQGSFPPPTLYYDDPAGCSWARTWINNNPDAQDGYVCGDEECGQVADAKDFCGRQVDCGSCPAGFNCEDNTCVNTNCAAETCQSLGVACGLTDDGCGRNLQCGSCPAGQECSDGQCACTETMLCQGQELVVSNPGGDCAAPPIRVMCANGCDATIPDCFEPPDTCEPLYECISPSVSRYMAQSCAATESLCQYGCDDATGQCKVPDCQGGEMCADCDGTPCARYLTGNVNPDDSDSCEVIEDLCNPLTGCTVDRCIEETNASFCQRLGKRCGSVSGIDNCDAVRAVNCTEWLGNCPAGQFCINNQCGACTQETDAALCIRLNKKCGPLTADDNCGVSRTVDCTAARCSPGEFCVDDKCQSCVQESDSAFCTRLDKRCGSVTDADNCGTSRTVDCTIASGLGDCPPTEVCVDNQCTCVTEPDNDFCVRLGKRCGTVNDKDNCGVTKTVDCTAAIGNCPAGQSCTNNQCTGTCSAETNAAFCTRLGKRCGSVTDLDNCGNSRTTDCTAALGACPAGQSCISNQCAAPCSSNPTAVYSGQTCFPFTVPCSAANCNQRNVSYYGGQQCAIGVSSGGGFGSHWPKDAGGAAIKKQWVLVKSYDWTVPGPVKKAAVNFAIVDDGVRVIVNGQNVYQNVKTPATGTNDCANMDPPGSIPKRDPIVDILSTGAVQQGANHMEVYGCWAPGTDYPDAWARICYEYGPGAASAGLNCTAPSSACSAETDAELCGCNGGKNCGQITVNDRCGASRTVNCGTCTAPQTCGGGGTVNVCGCAAETNAAFCNRLGKRCGSVAGTDNCGSARTTDCTTALGNCPAGQTCMNNQCVCAPETDDQFCSRLGVACGQSASGTDNCGTSRTVNPCTCASICSDSDQSAYTSTQGNYFALRNPLTAQSPFSHPGFATFTRPTNNADIYTVGTVQGCGYYSDVAGQNNDYGPEKRVGNACNNWLKIDVDSWQPQTLTLLSLQDACGGGGCPAGQLLEYFCFSGAARFPPSMTRPIEQHAWVGFQCVPCPAGTSCQGGKCACTTETNAEFCNRLGKRCGSVAGTDNCGVSKTVDCTAALGACPAGQMCSSNQCVCAPETNAQFCSRNGKNCGLFSANDNCGAWRNNVNCGSCASPNTCGGGGTANVCGCTDESPSTTCSRLGKNCGSFKTSNNCGKTVTVSCGTCPAGQYCGGAFTPNVCGVDVCEYRKPGTYWWPGAFSFDPATANYGYAAWLRGCGETGSPNYNINSCPQWGIAPFPSGDQCGAQTCPQGFKSSVPGGGCTCTWPTASGGCGDHKACQSCLCVGVSGPVAGQCGLARQVGEGCTNPEDCGSRNCQGGICRIGGPGSYCVYPGDCQSGVCNGGIPSPVIKRGNCG